MEQGRESSADLKQLVERVAQLEAIVSQQSSLIAQQQAAITAYQGQLERQHEQIVLLKRALFSSKRERYVPSPDQRLLFTSLAEESPAAEEAAEAEEQEPPPAQRARRRGKRFVFPEGLPTRRHEYPLSPEAQACSCCHEPRAVISQQVTRQLEVEPAQAYVVEHVRFTYACAKCRLGEQVQTSARPPLPIEKSPFGPSVLAAILTNKYACDSGIYPIHREAAPAVTGSW